jgi:hypothetical protein
MMSEITERTKKTIAALFSEKEQGLVEAELESKCSTNVPGCSNWANSQLERIWFAVLKLSDGDIKKLRSSIQLANTDFRDLFAAADFGHDLEAHNKWFQEQNCEQLR